MDLKEAIGYRQLCFFCGRSVKLTVMGRPNLHIDRSVKGLRVRSGHTNGIIMFFGFDGSYQRGKKEYEIYRQPIQIWASCSTCKCEPRQTYIPKLPSISNAGRFLFQSSINNLKMNGSVFTFDLSGCDISESYEVRPQMDVVRLFNEETFYHWTTDFQENTTTLQSAKFSETLDNLLSLRLPAASLATVKNKEDFMRKYKLFTLFS